MVTGMKRERERERGEGEAGGEEEGERERERNVEGYTEHMKQGAKERDTLTANDNNSRSFVIDNLNGWVGLIVSCCIHARNRASRSTFTFITKSKQIKCIYKLINQLGSTNSKQDGMKKDEK